MGQKGSKVFVAEDWLKPHHAHKCSDVDLKKLRAFIKTGKLAPCFLPYEGEDWRSKELEECPICFLAYPALNRTKCCGKEICTECFLQVKLPNGNRGGALCPYCKSEFSVMFRGAQTAEERAACHAEEQRVTEATLRAREAEHARNEEKALKLRLAREGQAVAGPASPPSKVDQPEALISSPVARKSLCPESTPEPAVPASRRRSGDIDHEALRIVLNSLNLSDFVPSRIASSSTAEIEDAMLQQAIQASLEESQFSSLPFAGPLFSVQPEAVFSEGPHSSAPATPNPSQQICSSRTAGPEASSSTDLATAPHLDTDTWDEVDLSSGEVHAAQHSSPLEDTPTDSAQESLGQPACEERVAASNAVDASERQEEEEGGQDIDQSDEKAEAPSIDVIISDAASPDGLETSPVKAAAEGSILPQQETPPLPRADPQESSSPGRPSEGSSNDADAAQPSESASMQQGLPENAQEAVPAQGPQTSISAEITETPAAKRVRHYDELMDWEAWVSQSEGESPLKAESIPQASKLIVTREEPTASSREDLPVQITDGSKLRKKSGPLVEAVAEGCNAPQPAEEPMSAAQDSSSEKISAPAYEKEEPGQAQQIFSQPFVPEYEQQTPRGDQRLEEMATAGYADGHQGIISDQTAERQAIAQHDMASSGSEADLNSRPHLGWLGSQPMVNPEVTSGFYMPPEAERFAPLEAHIARRNPASRAASAISLDLSMDRLQRDAHISSDGGSEGSLTEADPHAPHQLQAAVPQPLHGAAAQNMCPNASRGDAARGLTEGSSLLRPPLLRRGSSASSNEELIGALHSPTPPSPRAKTPLPAPPTHLKAFLSGGKRFASPLSGRHPSLLGGSDDRKGPSFADLLNRKGKGYQSPSRRSFREKFRAVHSEPLRVAMVMADPPSPGIAKQEGKPQPQVGSPAVASSLSSSQQEVQARSLLNDLKNGQQSEGMPDSQGEAQHYAGDSTARTKGPVLYEEPSSSSYMALERDGGAVFLSQPDGTTQLVLLTPDQKTLISEAQAMKQALQESVTDADADTYTAPSTANDLRVQRRIREADEAMRRLYFELQEQHGQPAPSTLDPREAGHSEDFAAKLRHADDEFKAALERRDAATRISQQPVQDASDQALQSKIALEDATLFQSRKLD